MALDRNWQGVRLRQVAIGADPDQPSRLVRLPAAWDDGAAAALCMLAPGTGPLSLPTMAQSWIRRLDGPGGLAMRLHSLLLLRRGAPSAGIWAGTAEDQPGFVLNLPAFHDPAAGFDTEAFAAAVETAAHTLQRAAAGRPARAGIAIADLAGLLALLGLDYAGAAARDVAACLAAVLRGRADAGMAGPQLDLLGSPTPWPAPPACCAVPRLAEAAAAARQAASGAASAIRCTAILPPGPVDALLGVETGGISPSFSPVGSGGLTRSAHAWLHARGIGLEAALAAAVANEPLFPHVRPTDHAAMHDAVAPYLHAMPPRPAAAEPTGNARGSRHREELPARRRGFTQKAAIGGHRIFMHTGEYADGRLGEIGLSLPRESATTRGLADAFAAAISLGLQHGVPLDSFVDRFVQTADGAGAAARFAPAGAVEGDPAVDRAASIPDYVFRSLAASYLGRDVAPDVQPAPDLIEEPSPLLPLDLPTSETRRRRLGLRLVAA